MAGTARRAGWLIAGAASLAVAGLAGPAVAAADDHLAGATVTSAMTATVPPAPPSPESGTILLLVVAGSLGVLGVLSGPEGKPIGRHAHRLDQPTR